MTLPSTGFHYGVPFEQYAEWPAVNISRIKPISRSLLHCRHSIDHPREPSEEMNVGSALHIAILEPARFEKEFFICPEYDGRTTEGKEIRAQAEFDAGSRTIIRRKASESAVDGDDVEGMAKAIWGFQAPRKFLELPGQCEVSALWRDEVTGLTCKGRFDKCILFGGTQTILELKSTRDASERGFAKQVGQLHYAAQAAFYRWGAQVITGQAPLHAFLAIENKPPYAAGVYTLDDEALQIGALEFRSWLDRYAEAEKNNRWPGYPDEVRVLTLPRWVSAAA